MTFVGKILVLVILAFALFFLALSTVVFTATSNWQGAYTGVTKERDALNQQLNTAKTELETQQAALQKEVADREAQVGALQATGAQLDEQIQGLQTETTSLRTQVEEAQRTSQTNVQIAQSTTQEAAQLREQFQAAQKVANDYAAQQSQLNEQIFLLQRQLDTASQNNEDLRDAVANYQNYLQSRGLPSDPEQVRLAADGTTVSPDIEGRVLRVEARGELIEISIGSDDGVVAGQEYSIYRTGDTPQYIAKIRITLAEADTAVARVTESYLGRKVKEGDNVSS